MKVLVFDTETGGLDPDKHSVFSFGAIAGDLDTGEVFETYEAYHKLPSIDDYVYVNEAIEVHSITPEKAFREGVPSTEIQDKMMDLWTKYSCVLVAGHNVDYDVRMVAQQIFGISVLEFNSNFGYRKLDSLPLVRLMAGTDNIKSGATVKQVIKMLSIDISDLGGAYHAALFDAICTFRILHKFRQVLTDPDVVEKLAK